MTTIVSTVYWTQGIYGEPSGYGAGTLLDPYVVAGDVALAQAQLKLLLDMIEGLQGSRPATVEAIPVTTDPKAYNAGRAAILAGTFNLQDTLKALLVTTDYEFDPDHDVATIAGFEPTLTGYTGGFAGAGRKAVAGLGVWQDNASDQAVSYNESASWTGLGAANEDTVLGVVLVWENTSDADSIPVAYLPLDTPASPTGQDVTVDFGQGAMALI